MPHRLFIAIRPPEDVRDRLVDAMEGIEGARWADEENLHLTLRFVGEVERPQANDLAGALARIAWPRFALRIEGVGHFSRKGSASALWARVPASEPLEGLRQKVEAACEAAGSGQIDIKHLRPLPRSGRAPSSAARRRRRSPGAEW